MIPARSFMMIRHGETVLNAQKLACGGGIDTELNGKGRAQAQNASRILNHLPEKPTLIIHSGMNRTRETARILNETLQLPMLEDNDLREHMLGEWEKLPWDQMIPHLRDDDKPRGGESSTEYGIRVRETLTKHLKDHVFERILFVAHGGTFHAFQRFHGQMRRTYIENAALHRFDPEPAHQPMPWRVSVYGWGEGLTIKPATICPSIPEPADDGA